MPSELEAFLDILQIRNPNVEYRNKHEWRKIEIQNEKAFRKFEIQKLFRISDFGFRILGQEIHVASGKQMKMQLQ